MTLLSHLGHAVPRSPLHLLQTAESPTTAERPDIDPRVFAVHRLGAVGIGLFLLVFGILGALDDVGFLATHGGRYLGLSSNGLLSALSLVVAAVLFGAALRGPRPASTVMIVLGVLFLASALVNLALLRSAFNLLAFRMSNVVFSVAVGLILLVLGAYGRITGNLPENSPYAHPRDLVQEPLGLPSNPEEIAAEATMRQAEIAVVQHTATSDQCDRVRAMARARTRDGRRRIWMEFDEPAGVQRAM